MATHNVETAMDLVKEEVRKVQRKEPQPNSLQGLLKEQLEAKDYLLRAVQKDSIWSGGSFVVPFKFNCKKRKRSEYRRNLCQQK